MITAIKERRSRIILYVVINTTNLGEFMTSYSILSDRTIKFISSNASQANFDIWYVNQIVKELLMPSLSFIL